MFLKILKLIIRTRFALSYFIIIFIFIAYALLSLSLSFSATGSQFDAYYFSGILILFSMISVVMGGLSMSKSDSEFLIVSPVNRRELASALYIAQYLYTGPIILAVIMVYALVIPHNPLSFGLLIMDTALLSTFPVSLSVTTSVLSYPKRIIVGAAIIVWIVSSFIGFNFSPTAIYRGQIVDASISTIAVTLVTLIIALSLFSNEELPFRVLDLRRTKSDYKSIKSYIGLNPKRAIFQFAFSQFEIASRSNFSGTPTLSGRKIRTIFVFILISIVSVVYGILAYRYNPTAQNAIPGALPINFVTFFASLYAGILPAGIMSGSTIPMERAWLSFTSMKASTYMPALTIAKIIQTVFILLPFAVVDTVLYFLNVSGALENMVVFMVYTPLLVGLLLPLNYRVQNYQIKEERLLQSRFNAAQFILLPPVLIYIVVVLLSMFLLIIDVYAIPIASVLLVFLLTRKKFWNERIYKLVEKGFV